MTKGTSGRGKVNTGFWVQTPFAVTPEISNTRKFNKQGWHLLLQAFRIKESESYMSLNGRETWLSGRKLKETRLLFNSN